jgi:transposase
MADPVHGRSYYNRIGRCCLESLVAALMTVEHEIATSERQILVWHRSNERCRRLASIPGIGPIIATALIASVLMYGRSG